MPGDSPATVAAGTNGRTRILAPLPRIPASNNCIDPVWTIHSSTREAKNRIQDRSAMILKRALRLKPDRSVALTRCRLCRNTATRPRQRARGGRLPKHRIQVWSSEIRARYRSAQSLALSEGGIRRTSISRGKLRGSCNRRSRMAAPRT